MTRGYLENHNDVESRASVVPLVYRAVVDVVSTEAGTSTETNPKAQDKQYLSKGDDVHNYLDDLIVELLVKK